MPLVACVCSECPGVLQSAAAAPFTGELDIPEQCGKAEGRRGCCGFSVFSLTLCCDRRRFVIRVFAESSGQQDLQDHGHHLCPRRVAFGGYLVIAVFYNRVREDCSTSAFLHCQGIYSSSFSACVPRRLLSPTPQDPCAGIWGCYLILDFFGCVIT